MSGIRYDVSGDILNQSCLPKGMQREMKMNFKLYSRFWFVISMLY